MTETITDKALVRIAIAKDVLKQMRYWEVETTYFYSTKITQPYSNLQTQLLTLPKKSCHVCALGACFLSYVRLYDEVKTDNYGGVMWPVIQSTLLKYFELDQLNLIEAAFELWFKFNIDFNNAYWMEEPVFRLRKIMQNIVANKGDFVVEKYIKAAKRYAEKKGIKTNEN